MKKIRLLLAGLFLFISFVTALTLTQASAPTYAAEADTTCECPGFADSTCGGVTFLGFPRWYKYLKSQPYTDEGTGLRTCVPKIEGLNSIWKIVAAVIEMITRLATLVAIGFIVFGGVTYTLSQGNPDKTKQALKTIINALVGLVITVIAAALVSFIAGRFN